MTNAPTPYAGPALRVIAGEDKAREYLLKLRDGTAQPDDLALMLAALYGPELRGFARTLAKALLEVPHA